MLLFARVTNTVQRESLTVGGVLIMASRPGVVS